MSGGWSVSQKEAARKELVLFHGKSLVRIMGALESSHVNREELANDVSAYIEETLLGLEAITNSNGFYCGRCKQTMGAKDMYIAEGWDVTQHLNCPQIEAMKLLLKKVRGKC